MKVNRRSGWRMALAVVLILAIASTAAGCGGGSDSATGSTGNVSAEPVAAGDGDPVVGGNLVYALSAESTGWAPTMDQWSPSSFNVVRAIFDPLVVVGQDGEFHPWLAEALTPDDLGRTWRIDIRPGIAFHNGQPLDAAAVAANIEAMKASPLTSFGFTPITAVEVIDADTVEIRLDRSWYSLPGVFAGQGGIIVAPEQLESGDNQNPIGSGPFTFESWTKNDELVVKKNPSYWRTDATGRALPYLDQVTFTVVTDPTGRRDAVQSGDADLAHFSEAGTVAELIAQPPDGTNLLVDESQGDEMTVVLNGQSGATSDERVRKAMQLSTDRDAISAQYDDAFAIADGPFTPDSAWWTEPKQPERDLDRATALVAEYRADTGSAPSITLAAQANLDATTLAQLLQSQWGEAGIDVTIDAQETTKYASSVVNGQADALLLSYWNGEDPDVDYIYWTGANIGPPDGISLNFARWSNPEVDAALETGRTEKDPAVRKQAYATVFDQFAEHAPIIFLYHVTWVALSDQRVKIGAVELPEGDGQTQPIIWGAVNLSTTWLAA